MGNGKFIDSGLVKIRDKLSDSVSDTSEKDSPLQDNSQKKKSQSSDHVPVSTKTRQSAVTNDKEWKKTLFRRWDEFKNAREELLDGLAAKIASAPEEIKLLKSNISDLEHSLVKYEKLLDKLKDTDDAGWNRQTLVAELTKNMRLLENIRIEFIMLSSKTHFTMNADADIVNKSFSNGNSFIHELNSFSFKQCFRLGLAFFMPLILGILFAVAVWAAVFYLSLH